MAGQTEGRAGKRPAAANKGNSPAVSFRDEVTLWVVLAFSIILFLSNFGIAGKAGGFISGIFFGVFGLAAYIFPFLLFAFTAFLISNQDNRAALIKAAASVAFFLFICMFLELTGGDSLAKSPLDSYLWANKHKYGGGLVGGLFVWLIRPNLGTISAFVINIVMLIICLVFITQRSIWKQIETKSRKVYHSAKNETIRQHKQYTQDRQRRLDKKVTGVCSDTSIKGRAKPGPSDNVNELHPESVPVQSFPIHMMGEERPDEKSVSFPTQAAVGMEYRPDVAASAQNAAVQPAAPGFADKIIPIRSQKIALQPNENAHANKNAQQSERAQANNKMSHAAEEAEDILAKSSDVFSELFPDTGSGANDGSKPLYGQETGAQHFPIQPEMNAAESNDSGESYDPAFETERTAGASGSFAAESGTEPFDAMSAAESMTEPLGAAFGAESYADAYAPEAALAEESHVDAYGLEDAPAGESYSDAYGLGDVLAGESRADAYGLGAAPAGGSRTDAYGLGAAPAGEGRADAYGLRDALAGEGYGLENAPAGEGYADAYGLGDAPAGEGYADAYGLEDALANESDADAYAPVAASAEELIAQQLQSAGVPKQRVSLKPQAAQNEQTAYAPAPAHSNPKSNPKQSQAEIASGVTEIGVQLNQAQPVIKREHVFPPACLLNYGDPNKTGDSKQHLQETALKLQQTLKNFGVNVKILNVSCGPSVTRYEIQPEMGVKVSKIVGLTDDIKLNLAAADIRMEAPIPGKAAIGIEVPNKENIPVMFRDLVETEDFKRHKSPCTFAVGKDIAGQVVVTDICKMPHLLIAGATGSGKSVCINTIIMSILYKANPDDVKLIMIDPKVVELSVYNGIPHLLLPVVTDPKKAAGALHWAVSEMMDRYQKFAECGVRDIKGYNAKVARIEHIQEEGKPQKMTYIVIIVDELADLMMVAPGDVEDAICRLAQLARAAGIHLIIATQRPSVNVITGLIKANMPSRIAFSVTSGIDSRTILDMNGAEKLLGKGDMLFYPQGIPKPIRVQGAFVSDSEVSKVVDFLTEKNGTTQYNNAIEEQMSNALSGVGQASSDGSSEDARDVYFVDAAKLLMEKDKASVSMLQRYFKIGFNRAARIMEQLEEAGIVGAEEGTKPRKILMSPEEFEQYVEEVL